MANPVREIKRVEQVAATVCTCCGRPLTSGTGFDVPMIGIVGPQCAAKFGAFVQVLDWIDGRRGAATQDQRALLNSVRVKLAECGVQIDTSTGECRVTGLIRKPADVARSFKKTRARFVTDLQIAAGLFGADAQAAHLAAQAAA